MCPWAHALRPGVSPGDAVKSVGAALITDNEPLLVAAFFLRPSTTVPVTFVDTSARTHKTDMIVPQFPTGGEVRGAHGALLVDSQVAVVWQPAR